MDSESVHRKFGFISFLELENHGVAGGLLVLDRVGRPAEFHCTVPIYPDRFQQILYGQSLLLSLINDQIAPALVDKCRENVDLWFTDRCEFSNFANEHVGTWVYADCRGETDSPNGGEASEKARLLETQPERRIDIDGLTLCILGRLDCSNSDWAEQDGDVNNIAHSGAKDFERNAATRQLVQQFAYLDSIQEPFARVHEAIAEAQAVCS